MAGANQYKAKEFIDAIAGTGGIITTIANRVGCSWHTAKKYIDTYPTVTVAYADELDKNLDVAEAIIIDNLKLLRKEQEQTRKPVETSDARWLLATKGKARGYSQKQEVEMSGNVDGRRVIEYVNDWRPNHSTVPALGPAGSNESGEAVQLAGSGPTLEENDAGHDNSG